MTYLEKLKANGFDVDNLNENQTALYKKYLRNKGVFEATEFEDEDQKQERQRNVDLSKEKFEATLAKKNDTPPTPPIPPGPPTPSIDEPKKTNWGFIGFLGITALTALFIISGTEAPKQK